MDEKIPGEKWKPLEIKNALSNGTIHISNYGRIKSFKVSMEGKLISGSTIAGYKMISVALKGNKFKTVYLHIVVAEAFVLGKAPSKTLVAHLDYQKDNNYYKNLKWMSKSEMTAHHKANPDRPIRVITNSKLTVAKVKQIKKLLLKENVTLYKIAAKFGITHTQLNRIRKGENWGHVSID